MAARGVYTLYNHAYNHPFTLNLSLSSLNLSPLSSPSLRDILIEQHMREVVELRKWISELEEVDQELIARLHERQTQLEAEIQKHKDIIDQTCNVSWQGGCIHH